MFFVVLITLR
jgi:ankyrin repeat protein